MAVQEVVSLKSVSLPLGFRGRKIYGGPYRQKPFGMRGVKMAQEIDMPFFVSVPTKDFSVPDTYQMVDGVEKTLMALAKGHDVYVGCMGGIGRTGLFLAVLAKTLGIKDPVGWVRKNYMPHAVETAQQKRYVDEFPTDLLDYAVFKAKVVAGLLFWKK